MKDDIKLPPEFISGNSTPVTVATIKRERMEEILREAVEADRKKRGEPVGYIRVDHLNKVLRGWSHMCQIQSEPQQGTVAIYTNPQPVTNIGRKNMTTFHDWLYLDQTQFDTDELNKREIELAQLAWEEAQEGTVAIYEAPTQHTNPAQKPVSWHTEDHLTDKSATTYDPVVAERWIEKGWPVTPLFYAPQSVTQKGDMRLKDGKLWICTDPDIDRWVCPDDRGWQLVPKEPAEEMLKVGGHVNSEWLNDNAPIGENRYSMPMKYVYQSMLKAAPKFGEEK